MIQEQHAMDVELFILKVKENNAIYDASDKNHSNRSFIASVWRKIGAELNIPGEQLNKKWHQLRSNYMRIKRTERNKLPSSRTKTKTTWPYFELMSFLDQYSETNDTSSHTQEPCQKLNSNCDRVSNDRFNPAEEKVSIEEDNVEQSVPINSQVKKKKKCKRTIESVPKDDIDLQFLSELRKINSARYDEDDPDRMFLLSLLPSVRKLTPAKNMDFKLNALQFLKEALSLSSGVSSELLEAEALNQNQIASNLVSPSASHSFH